MERNFYSAPTYQSVCVAHDGACAAPATSALAAFYGTDHLQRLAGNATCELLGDDFVEQTWRAMVAAANASTAGRLAHGMFMAKGAIASGVSTKTRSLLYVGAPLEGFTSITDRAAEQYDVYNAYVEAVEARLWTHFGVESTLFRSAYLEPWVRGGVRFRSFSFFLYRLEWIRLQEMDSLWMVVAILFVALWIRVHTGFLRFAAAATTQILLSIPVTALVYRFVFGFEYFAFLHLCSIFVVLGIGADDNFVLLDAWRQALTDVPDGDETRLRRLLYAFDRARAAIFNTSLTTAVAFLCLGASPLMPVRTFGVFAACVVVCNYVMVMGAAEWVYGWDLGVIEALAGVLVIGFSVDYATHLCHMYVEADKVGITNNLERFVYAITKMGGTVVGGAVTTLGAAAFMLPCQLTFFYKLGLLIFTTILCSFCFSFGFVMPLLAAAGPSGDRCGFRFHAPARVAAAPTGKPSPRLIYPINGDASSAVPVDPAADELPAPLTVYRPNP